LCDVNAHLRERLVRLGVLALLYFAAVQAASSGVAGRGPPSVSVGLSNPGKRAVDNLSCTRPDLTASNQVLSNSDFDVKRWHLADSGGAVALGMKTMPPRFGCAVQMARASSMNHLEPAAGLCIEAEFVVSAAQVLREL